jgi:sugar lactone lactonase YvrE
MPTPRPISLPPTRPRVAPAIRTTRVHAGGATGFRAPYGVAADRVGRLVVGDVRAGRVRVLDPAGDPLHAWGGAGFAPYGVAVGPDGTVWVADPLAGRVSGHAPRGARVAVLGEAVGFALPSGVAVGEDGRVAVADTGNRRVVVFAADGALEAVLGVGHLVEPIGVAIDRLGQVVVVDRARKRLIRFGAEPEYPDVMPLGLLPGVPAAPWGVAVDAAGRMLVSVSVIQRLLLLAPDGQFLGTWTAEADGHGPLLHPTALALAPSGALLVADTYNDRVIEAAVAA